MTKKTIAAALALLLTVTSASAQILDPCRNNDGSGGCNCHHYSCY